MSIFDVLRYDHSLIQQFMAELLLLHDTEILKRDSLIKSLGEELFSHTRAEEIVLYNLLRMADFSKLLALGGYKEHIEIETLLHLIQLKNVIHSSWRETALRLQGVLQLHVQEEESAIFAMAKDFFTFQEFESMGKEFLNQKMKVKQEGYLEVHNRSAPNYLPQQMQNETYSYPADL